MTSRLNQRAISILAGLAIVLLLLLIIFLWTGVQNGLFSKSHQSSGSAHKLTGKSSVISSISKTISGNIMTPSFSISHKSGNNDMKLNNMESVGKKIFIPPTNIDSTKDTEIVKPIKMSPLPLHEQDLIYEQSKYGDRGEMKIDSKYHSGHFRYKNASIWDPHPEYEIRAFGKALHLKLSQDSNFVASDIKFSQMVNNELSNITADYKSEGCFYTGIVEGDRFSSVAVSLCHGMTGYIRTENETYLIEPTENFQKDATTILHAMQRQKFNKEHNIEPIDNLVDLPTSNCDTTSDLSTNYDDNSRQKRSIRSQYNWYDRRKLLSMRYAKEYIDDDQYSTFYPNDEYNYQYGGSGNNIVHYDDKYMYTDNRDWGMNNQPVYSAYTEERRWKRQDGTTMTENQDYVVEVLIIVDGSLKSKKLLKGDLHHYILTLMSHVALLFKNDTLGNSIRISVVGIIDLDDYDIMKTSNNRDLNSTEMLKVFCEWQKYSEYTKNYRKNRSYNVAVLLTRSKLCRTPTDCNVLGVANESTMCKKDSCAIVKETGLGTSFTIAHEIGHVLGMPHDGSRSCQRIHNNKQILGAMAHQMTEISNPWLWSPCAKHHLSEFIDSAKSKCLLKTPSAVDMIIEKDENGRIRLPGVDITPEEQCKLIDPDYTLCPARQDTCDTLWCKNYQTHQYNECRLFHHTVADGTLCNKTLSNPGICLQGKCVNPNNIKSVAGGWGPYGDWGECSMSCGGGIKKRRRECNNPRPYFGQYCRGTAVEYTTCNTYACVINPNHPYADARESQCSAFNGNNFNIPSVPHNVRWLPKYGLENKNKCVLYCRVENRKDYYKFAEKVKDGTKCDLNQYDICVNGICKKGGCDHALGSDLTLDMCGNCGGDNSTCHEINNTANEILYKNHDGYIDVITIPQGSYNIKIWKKNIKSKDGSYFYLALKNESGGYIFNGNYRIQKNETSQFYGGLQFVYTGSKLNEEKITSNQKFALTKPLVVQVLKSGSLSTTVHYSYMVNRNPEYTWTYGNWTECTEECEGHKYQHAICVQDISHRQVPPEYCAHKTKPESYATPCNIRCKFRWERAETSECSKPCEGERHIFYHCVLIDYNQSKKVVHDNNCMDINKPPRIEKCNGPCETPTIPQWTTGNWSACSTTCDLGQQLRTVVCTDQYLRPLSSSLCKTKKPSDIQLCKIDSCPKWIEKNHWEPCSATCGKGTQARYYECQREGIRIPDHFCNSERPQMNKECYSYSHCYGNWTHSSWGECDQNCYRIRHLNCVNLKNGDILDVSKCDERHKPPHAERCYQCAGSKQVKKNRRIAACHWKDMGCPQSCDELNKRRFMCVNKYTNKKCRDVRYCGTKKLFSQCPPILYCPKTKYRWVIEKWGQCINGIQKRKMHCENEYGKKIRRNLCPAIKPRRKQKCVKIYKRCRDIQTKLNKQEDGEYLLTVRGKQVRIYCDGMNTNRPVEYLTIMSDFNYARFNNTQSENPSLDCAAPQRARPLKNHLGHTNFARIRLHLATLKVQIDDFKYATHFGDPNMKMRYGTAGDCYSLNNCPQGIFSIYLENTGFQVSPKTKWKGIEPKSSVKVDYRDPRNIRGKCGGYCGSCEPEEPNGLMLEVT